MPKSNLARKHAQERLSRTYQALADPARRSMVARLSQGPASVSELARPLDMSLPAVFQHLRLLEECGLVRSEKQGRVRTCRLAPEALDRAADWLHALRKTWTARFDRLETVLTEMNDDATND